MTLTAAEGHRDGARKVLPIFTGVREDRLIGGSILHDKGPGVLGSIVPLLEILIDPISEM